MNNKSQPLTKKDLVGALKENNLELMKTIKKEVSLPVAEKITELGDELGGRIDNLENRFDNLTTEFTKLDVKVDKFKNEILEKTTRDKDEILKSNDKLIDELQDIRDEQAATSETLKQHKEKIDKLEPVFEDCEKRLKAIERQPA